MGHIISRIARVTASLFLLRHARGRHAAGRGKKRVQTSRAWSSRQGSRLGRRWRSCGTLPSLRELPPYLVATAGVAIDHTEGKEDHTFTEQVLNWWATNGSKLPTWAEAAQIVFAFSPNSAAAERVFSLLKLMFGDQQMSALADIIRTALMLRYHELAVG